MSILAFRRKTKSVCTYLDSIKGMYHRLWSPYDIFSLRGSMTALIVADEENQASALMVCINSWVKIRRSFLCIGQWLPSLVASQVLGHNSKKMMK